MRKGEYPNNRHDALHQRAMSKWKAGGYGLDKKEPESMDVPEVCSFDTYGILHNPLRCKGILIVVCDVRFGVIPVCMKHRILVIKRRPMSDKELIEFLWKLLWNDLSDGDTPSDKELETLKEELTKRGILDGDFSY